MVALKDTRDKDVGRNLVRTIRLGDSGGVTGYHICTADKGIFL